MWTHCGHTVDTLVQNMAKRPKDVIQMCTRCIRIDTNILVERMANMPSGVKDLMLRLKSGLTETPTAQFTGATL